MATLAELITFRDNAIELYKAEINRKDISQHDSLKAFQLLGVINGLDTALRNNPKKDFFLLTSTHPLDKWTFSTNVSDPSLINIDALDLNSAIIAVITEADKFINSKEYFQNDPLYTQYADHHETYTFNPDSPPIYDDMTSDTSPSLSSASTSSSLQMTMDPVTVPTISPNESTVKMKKTTQIPLNNILTLQKDLLKQLMINVRIIARRKRNSLETEQAFKNIRSIHGLCSQLNTSYTELNLTPNDYQLSYNEIPFTQISSDISTNLNFPIVIPTKQATDKSTITMEYDIIDAVASFLLKASNQEKTKPTDTPTNTSSSSTPKPTKPLPIPNNLQYGSYLSKTDQYILSQSLEALYQANKATHDNLTSSDGDTDPDSDMLKVDGSTTTSRSASPQTVPNQDEPESNRSASTRAAEWNTLQHALDDLNKNLEDLERQVDRSLSKDNNTKRSTLNETPRNEADSDDDTHSTSSGEIEMNDDDDDDDLFRNNEDDDYTLKPILTNVKPSEETNRSQISTKPRSTITFTNRNRSASPTFSDSEDSDNDSSRHSDSRPPSPTSSYNDEGDQYDLMHAFWWLQDTEDPEFAWARNPSEGFDIQEVINYVERLNAKLDDVIKSNTPPVSDQAKKLRTTLLNRNIIPFLTHLIEKDEQSINMIHIGQAVDELSEYAYQADQIIGIYDSINAILKTTQDNPRHDRVSASSRVTQTKPATPLRQQANTLYYEAIKRLEMLREIAANGQNDAFTVKAASLLEQFYASQILPDMNTLLADDNSTDENIQLKIRALNGLLLPIRHFFNTFEHYNPNARSSNQEPSGKSSAKVNTYPGVDKLKTNLRNQAKDLNDVYVRSAAFHDKITPEKQSASGTDPNVTVPVRSPSQAKLMITADDQPMTASTNEHLTVDPALYNDQKDYNTIKDTKIFTIINESEGCASAVFGFERPRNDAARIAYAKAHLASAIKLGEGPTLVLHNSNDAELLYHAYRVCLANNIPIDQPSKTHRMFHVFVKARDDNQPANNSPYLLDHFNPTPAPVQIQANIKSVYVYAKQSVPASLPLPKNRNNRPPLSSPSQM